MGYHPTGAYKLYDPVKSRIVISRDVIIDETATFKWNGIEDSSVNPPDTIVTTWMEDKRPEDNKHTTNA